VVYDNSQPQDLRFMSRKPGKGYYIDGEFAPKGSELDRQFRAELKGTEAASRSELKRESEELQALGEDLLELHGETLEQLPLSDALHKAILEGKRIDARGGGRRQRQLIGKLMRQQDDETIAAIRAAIALQHGLSARDNATLHLAERWRDQLIADDGALDLWLAEQPATDARQLRTLIRQARKDAGPARQPGGLPRQGRAYRSIFQLLRSQLRQKEQQA
jgi:ribosome-associated protein